MNSKASIKGDEGLLGKRKSPSVPPASHSGIRTNGSKGKPLSKIIAMMKSDPNTERGAPLGLFSHLVLGTILELKEQNQPTHGLRITEHLMAATNTLIDPGQTYLTLKRLAARQPQLVRRATKHPAV